MATSIPLQIAETIQTASLKRDPSPTHDINPSTAASQKIPVSLQSETSYDEIDDEDDDIPYSVLKPTPRRKSFGPLPDLRFEQSYLASIRGAESWWMVGLITARDQVFMPLLQGLLWSLIPIGWRYWNRNAELSGATVGSKVRRWWYKTNNWNLPDINGRMGNRDYVEKVGDFYQNQSSSD